MENSNYMFSFGSSLPVPGGFRKTLADSEEPEVKEPYCPSKGIQHLVESNDDFNQIENEVIRNVIVNRLETIIEETREYFKKLKEE